MRTEHHLIHVLKITFEPRMKLVDCKEAVTENRMIA